VDLVFPTSRGAAALQQLAHNPDDHVVSSPDVAHQAENKLASGIADIQVVRLEPL
jgi:hypothetical protein